MAKRPVATDLNKHIKELPDVAKLLKKRRTAHRAIRIVVGVLITGMCIGIVLFLRMPKMQIYSITVSGNEIIDTDTVVAEVQKNLSGKYLYLIPKTNIFFYPKEDLYEHLSKDFPRFDSIEISLVNKTTLSIQVTEERGTALWCGEDSVAPDMTSQCYFTDTAGRIIDLAPYYSGNVYLRFFGGTIIAGNPLGQNFVDENSFHELMEFAEKVRSLGFQIKALRITPTGDDFFILDTGNSKTAYMQFKSGDEYDTLFSNLQTAIGTSELSSQISSDISNLQYFDLRFKNKVYYKFNDTSTSTKISTKKP